MKDIKDLVVDVVIKSLKSSGGNGFNGALQNAKVINDMRKTRKPKGVPYGFEWIINAYIGSYLISNQKALCVKDVHIGEAVGKKGKGRRDQPDIFFKIQKEQVKIEIKTTDLYRQTSRANSYNFNIIKSDIQKKPNYILLVGYPTVNGKSPDHFPGLCGVKLISICKCPETGYLIADDFRLFTVIANLP